MKKLIYSLAFAGGFFLLSSGIVIAQESAQKKTPVAQNVRSGYTDANGDGVCDNYEGVRPGKGKGPGNGQGLGRTNGKGYGFKAANGQRRMDGRGVGRNQGNGRQLRDGSGGNCPQQAK